ncbi:hypothetical protein ACN28C_25140 [Plantactinospora sp. WMMC1484]|uniref:hypothetical protein n=1 Tax=Plantactinospora sp. WMMC1484 TaxID=3404122 RepID=UPI003BF4F613
MRGSSARIPGGDRGAKDGRDQAMVDGDLAGLSLSRQMHPVRHRHERLSNRGQDEVDELTAALLLTVVDRGPVRLMVG